MAIEFTKIDEETLKSNSVKVGDLYVRYMVKVCDGAFWISRHCSKDESYDGGFVGIKYIPTENGIECVRKFCEEDAGLALARAEEPHECVATIALCCSIKFSVIRPSNKDLSEALDKARDETIEKLNKAFKDDDSVVLGLDGKFKATDYDDEVCSFVSSGDVGSMFFLESEHVIDRALFATCPSVIEEGGRLKGGAHIM